MCSLHFRPDWYTVVVQYYSSLVQQSLFLLPHTMVCLTSPLSRLSMLDISTAGIVPVPERSALESPRRELSEDVSFGLRTVLVVEQSIELGKPTQGCVMYTCTVV